MGATGFLNYSRPFIDAAKKVFETMIFTKLEPQKPLIKKDNTSLGDITAFLGIMGDYEKDNIKKSYKAMLVISFSYDTYIKVANAMLMENRTQYSQEISDVGGEICNMIMGSAKRYLVELGYSSNMAVPSIIEGKNHTISYPTSTNVVVIPMNSAYGTIYMELCYKEDD